MTDQNNKGLSNKFGSSILAGVQGLNSDPKTPKKQPKVRISRSTYANMLSTRILKGIGITALVLFLVYLALAITIVRVLPTTSVGMIPVKNITYKGGLVPAGADVVVSMGSAQGSSITDYLKQSFVPTEDAAVVKVISGPWGTYGWTDPGILSVDGKIVPNVLMKESGDKKLDNEYLVQCVSGACSKGDGYVVPASHLMGVPLAEVK